MALFSRRVLQRVLDENAAFLRPKELLDICNLLNIVRDDYLATEWEQVILNAASKIGSIEYQPVLAGRRPDLLFKSKLSSFEFLAEITTASDKGLKRLNPVDALHEEFARHQRKRNLVTGGFEVRIEPRNSNIYRGSKETVSLMVPKIAEFNTKIFNRAFHLFMDCVCNAPDQCHTYQALHSDTRVHFAYDPQRRGCNSGQYLSYAIANRIDQNPVYNALKSKADQLKATNYRGIQGIFLCDGGCHTLRDSASWANFSADEIVRHFLAQFESVAFVLVITVKERWSPPNREVTIVPVLSTRAKCNIDSELQPVIRELLAQMPKPVDTPENALRQLKHRKGLSGRYWGNLHMSRDVKLSARILLEILAGERKLEEFERDFSLNSGRNPFRRALAEGRMISDVSVERRANDDDDIITLHFGKKDAAIGPFKIGAAQD